MLVSIIAAMLSTASPAPPQPMTVEVRTDPITDQVRASAILRDDGNRLVVSCDPAEQEGARVSVHSRRWLARGNIFSGERPLIYRFDSERPRRHLWDIDDHRARLTNRRRAEAFIARMMTAEKLVVRARDMEDRQFDMIFRLAHVRPALEQLSQTCRAASPT